MARERGGLIRQIHLSIDMAMPHQAGAAQHKGLRRARSAVDYISDR